MRTHTARHAYPLTDEQRQQLEKECSEAHTQELCLILQALFPRQHEQVVRDSVMIAQHTLAVRLARGMDFPRNPQGWLYVTASRRASRCIKTGRRVRDSLPEYTTSTQAATHADPVHGEDMIPKYLSECLSDVEYQCVVLMYWRGLTQQQIANCIAKSQASVSRYLTVARTKLRCQLETRDPVDPT